jgi:hypothetical protein
VPPASGRCHVHGRSGELRGVLEEQPHVGGSAQAACGVFFEAPPEHGHDGRRLGRQLVPARLAAQDARDHVRHVRALEREVSGEHLEEHAAERPDVGALVHRLAACLLRAHVGGGAEDRAASGERGRGQRRRLRLARRRRGLVEGLRKPEVENLQRPVGPQLDVRRLQVAVHDPALVGGLECEGDLRAEPERFVERQPAARDALRERRPFDDLEHESGPAVCLL